MKVILGGDVMLGRLVKEEIARYGINYPLGAIAPIIQQANLVIFNLECAITDHAKHWSGMPKAFYFGAPPIAAKILADLKTDIVSLANNHILDFNDQGLQDTLKHLQDQGIHYAGAGINLDEALAPAIVQKQGYKLGMVAFCDHQSDFAASPNRPGMAYLNLNDEDHALQRIQTSLNSMRKLNVDYPILSLHWGPNMVDRPQKQFVRIAHKVIDMGYKLLFGHSAHVFHGIEIYKNCPIIYAAGDLVDDYAMDPYFRNDHQLLFQLELEQLNLKRIFLYPIFIDFCHTRLATEEEFAYIAERTHRLCVEMHTKVELFDSQRLVISLSEH